MKAVRRLEIVVDAPYCNEVTELLARHGLEGWTVLRGASGRGERGHRYGDEITGVSNNNVIITTCPPDDLTEIIEELRGVLERYGGMCLVSDAQWLIH